MKYALRKAGALIATLILVSLITFLAFNVIPGDPASAMLGTQATPEQLSSLRAQLGLNVPLPLRYLHWLTDFVRGNLGTSVKYSMPVRDLILQRLPVTLWLTLISLILIVVIAVPIGILTSKIKSPVFRALSTAADQIIMAIPPFFLGMLLILIFGVILRIFTPGHYIDYHEDPAGFFGYLILPALAIALPRAAMVIRFLRNSLSEQLKSDYVRTARSKGVDPNALLYRHVLKNALIPVVALFGMIVAEILAGSIIVEQVFGLPGIGRLLISSITSRDFPLIQSMVVCLAFIVVSVNFLTDLAFRVIDPRIRLN